MEIALIQYFAEHGFEVWITDVIEVDFGMGDVFSTHSEALAYAQNHSVPIVDISQFEMPLLETHELRQYLQQFLEISPLGEVVSILFRQ